MAPFPYYICNSTITTNNDTIITSDIFIDFYVSNIDYYYPSNIGYEEPIVIKPDKNKYKIEKKIGNRNNIPRINKKQFSRMAVRRG
jgi:hypothetical protein